jgi:lipopolysaccharide assembly outer membrane protein LptD (OstA)
MKQIKHLVLLFCIGLGLAVQAQEAEQETITFYARRMHISQEGQLVELSGDALLQLDAFTLLANAIQIQGGQNSGQTRTLQAQQDVKLRRSANAGQLLEAQSLHYNQGLGELRAWGSINFVDDEQAITIKASSLTFIDSDKSWRFEGSVTMEGKDFSTQSLAAIYYEKTKQLELHGAVRLISDGQRFEAEHILYHIETKELSMEQVRSGQLTIKTNP